MTKAHSVKLLVLLAGAAAASAGVSPLPPVAPVREPGPASGGRGGGVQVAAQSGPEESRQSGGEQLEPGERRVRVGDTQFIFNDIFDFSGSANDLFVWGWLPTISGEIADNGFFGGQKVDIAAEATIGGDAFVFAQTAIVRGHIQGDLYAFVADLTIAEGASVEGTVHGSSGAIVINGEVGGPIKYAAGGCIINGTVHGDVDLEVGELELGPGAVVEGGLTYESAREASIDSTARVGGEIRYSAPRDEESDEGEGASGGALSWFSIWSLVWDVLWLLSMFVVGAVALMVGGEAARRPAARLGSQPALGLGFGFVVAVVFPAAAILAMILIVTIPLGLIALSLYVAAAYLARLVAAQTVGDWLLGVVRGDREVSAYASLAVGLVVFHFLVKIPYVGFLIWIAAIVAGLGGIFLATRKAYAAESGSGAPAMTA